MFKNKKVKIEIFSYYTTTISCLYPPLNPKSGKLRAGPGGT